MSKRNTRLIYTAIAAVAVIAIAIVLIVINSGSSDRDFVIEDGVLTSYVGKETTVTVPKNVETIGNFAFKGHTEIEKVVIGGKTATIGEGAFYGCTGLKELKLASTVAYINDGAFGMCQALTEFTVPRDCVFLNSGAFYGDSGIKEFKVEDGNKTFTSIDGVLYLSNMVAVVSYPLAKTDAEYTIVDGVSNVASWCFFYAQNLKKVNIPSSVVEIGDNAFGESGITSVELPDSVKTLGKSAFSWCLELEDIKFGAGVEELPAECFEGCQKLTSLVIPENLISFQAWCLSYCGLGNVDFEGDLEYAEQNSFAENAELVLRAAKGSNTEDYASKCAYAFEAIR